MTARAKKTTPAQPAPAKAPASTAFLDRVRGLAWLPPARIQGAAQNFRTHDERQRRILRGLLDEIGVAGASLAWVPDDAARAALRALPGRDPQAFAAWLTAFEGPVQLIDGHARRSEIRQDAPVLICDLDSEEAAKALATFDAVSDLAGTDAEILAALLTSFERPANEDAASLITLLREVNGLDRPDFRPGAEGDQGRLDQKAKATCPACGHVF